MITKLIHNEKVKKVMFTYRFKADGFYPWLLLCALATAAILTWWQLQDLIGKSDMRVASHSVRNVLAYGLSALALLTLAWRIWFASRYRPYPLIADGALPNITVVIPAFNEGEQVLLTVRSVLASRYPAKKMRVICVDDGSQDDTWLWMQRAKKEFPKRVRLIFQPANRGKRHALMAGFAQAAGQIYVTIDSDSEVMPDTLWHLISPFADPRVGAVAGNVRVLNVDEGAIPKMMEVSFTNAFDFIRAGQSVYGGVFCTPGALSAYRASVIGPHLSSWAKQTFMGGAAAIGEDRALTNLVLGCGKRVVYQRAAIVLTKMPITFGGLRRMLLRWARSNVRENLVILLFVMKRFRTNDSGTGWIRLFTCTQLFRMAVGESFKLALVVQLLFAPLGTLKVLLLGCLISAIVPALVHQVRFGGWFGWRWAPPYAFFYLFGLSWIPLWGLLTAPRSGWLTRGLPAVPKSVFFAGVLKPVNISKVLPKPL
jgi:hyaluronan synthase